MSFWKRFWTWIDKLIDEHDDGRKDCLTCRDPYLYPNSCANKGNCRYDDGAA